MYYSGGRGGTHRCLHLVPRGTVRCRSRALVPSHSPPPHIPRYLTLLTLHTGYPVGAPPNRGQFLRHPFLFRSASLPLQCILTAPSTPAPCSQSAEPGCGKMPQSRHCRIRRKGTRAGGCPGHTSPPHLLLHDPAVMGVGPTSTQRLLLYQPLLRRAVVDTEDDKLLFNVALSMMKVTIRCCLLPLSMFTGGRTSRPTS
ncbi:hypothetical protein E2C01_026662 [Portunus trituberculatus]|uniref:Uncharacterized protein n=1 Tax=Portunus trituberculatus TaxID=210409 RepID=A0A5B7EIX8_PORTR|nr:hypothetical protein [Portunus trituberculatus]